MVESATGLVLRTRPLTETSLIVHWLTLNLGRLATVAKGARRPKSPFLGKLDLFYLADFSFARSQRSELHTLREVKVIQPNSFLRQELGFLRQAAYCVRFIEQTTETETPMTRTYELLVGWLQALPGRPCAPRTILAFELKFLNELGLQPNLDHSTLDPDTKALARELEKRDWPEIPQLPINAKCDNELAHFLRRFLLLHLGRVPPGREGALGS